MLPNPNSTESVPFWEKAFVVIALMVLAGAVIPVLHTEQGNVDPVGGDLVFQLIAAVIYVGFSVLMISRKGLAATVKNKEILLLLAFVLISVAWSVEPAITIRRSFALAGTTLCGVYLAFRFTLREQLRLVSIALGICALLSLLAIVILPKYGLMGEGEYSGSWRGVFVHKNSLGQIMALAAICFLILLLSKKRILLSLTSMSLCLLLIVGSQSMTAVGVLFALALLLPVLRVLRWPRLRLRYSLLTPVLIIGALITMGLGVWALLDFRNFLLAFGRDPTFSGRTYLWSAVLQMLQGHSWLGYGYGAFWIGEGETHTYTPNLAHWSIGGGDDVSQIVGWPVSHAHNGFLNMLVELGTIGMVLFLIGYFLSIWRAIRWVRITRDAHDLWPILYLAFLTLYNITESSILKRNSIFWVLYVAVAVDLALRKSPAAQDLNPEVQAS